MSSSSIVEKVDRFTSTRFVVDVTEPFRFVDASFETASWRDVLEIQPGQYPVELTNINGKPWNPDPAAKTPGYLGNTGPYYATVRFDATLRHTYREARLIAEVHAQETQPDEPTTHRWSTYAYNVADGATAISEWVDGQRVPRAVFRVVEDGAA